MRETSSGARRVRPQRGKLTGSESIVEGASAGFSWVASAAIIRRGFAPY